MRNVLIAGCGDVGAALAGRLSGKGYRVWGLKRDASTLDPGISPVACDLSLPVDPDILPASVQVLVYLPAPAARDESSYRAVYLQGLINLVQALKRRAAPVEQRVGSRPIPDRSNHLDTADIRAYVRRG